MKKIIWFSRHDILPSQVAELKRLFGDDVQIMRDPNPFSNADEVVERFKMLGADEMVIVAPLSVISALCDRGIKPLHAEMKEVPLEQAEVVAKNRGYQFVRFRRIKRVVLEFEDI